MRQKAVNWLVKTTGELISKGTDSSPLLTLYKFPLALVRGGEHILADILLEAIKRKYLNVLGDFEGKRWGFHKYHPAYLNVWLALAAHWLGRFDISSPSWDFIRRLYNEESGGYFTVVQSGDKSSMHMDIFTTSFISYAGLFFGDEHSAQHSARFLKNALEYQPGLPDSFFLRFQPDGKPLEKKPRDLLESKHYILRLNKPGEHYFFLGAPAWFLANIYLASGLDSHLNTARTYMDIALNSRPHSFTHASNIMVGIAAAQLYRITREEKYLHNAVDFFDHLAGEQKPQGYWLIDNEISFGAASELSFWFGEAVMILNQSLHAKQGKA